MRGVVDVEVGAGAGPGDGDGEGEGEEGEAGGGDGGPVASRLQGGVEMGGGDADQDEKDDGLREPCPSARRYEHTRVECLAWE